MYKGDRAIQSTHAAWVSALHWLGQSVKFFWVWEGTDAATAQFVAVHSLHIEHRLTVFLFFRPPGSSSCSRLEAPPEDDDEGSAMGESEAVSRLPEGVWGGGGEGADMVVRVSWSQQKL
jgi:hypothetical protein